MTVIGTPIGIGVGLAASETRDLVGQFLKPHTRALEGIRVCISFYTHQCTYWFTCLHGKLLVFTLFLICFNIFACICKQPGRNRGRARARAPRGCKGGPVAPWTDHTSPKSAAVFAVAARCPAVAFYTYMPMWVCALSAPVCVPVVCNVFTSNVDCTKPLNKKN